MFTIFSAVAQLERDIIRERVNAGVCDARANGTRFGRPTVEVNCEQILDLGARGTSPQQIAKDFGNGYGTVRSRLQIAVGEGRARTALQETNL
jgi:DNA invertase Pin-like site-specific DNA recombinase